MVQMVKDELQHDLVLDSDFYQYFSEARKLAIGDITKKFCKAKRYNTKSNTNGQTIRKDGISPNFSGDG